MRGNHVVESRDSTGWLLTCLSALALPINSMCGGSAEQLFNDSGVTLCLKDSWKALARSAMQSRWAIERADLKTSAEMNVLT